MKRFTISTFAFFYPPTPGKNPYDNCSVEGAKKFSAAGYKCKHTDNIEWIFLKGRIILNARELWMWWQSVKGQLE